MPISALPEHLHAGQYLKLRNFIPLDIIKSNKDIFIRFSENENAWFFLEKFLEENPDKMDWIDWFRLSENASMVPLLEKYPEKIDWKEFSKNKNAIRLLEKNPEKIAWNCLCVNENAIHLIEKNKDKITNFWKYLSGNEKAVPFLEKNMHRIDWGNLSLNKNAIHLLEENPDLIHWRALHFNSNAVHIFEKYPEKLDWSLICYNINAIPLLMKNPDKIDWDNIVQNPMAIEILEENEDELNWYYLTTNHNAMRLIEKDLLKVVISVIADGIKNPDIDIDLNEWCDENQWKLLVRNPGIFELDYEAIRKRAMIFKEELMENVYHPKRMRKIFDLLEEKGEDISCLEKYI